MAVHTKQEFAILCGIKTKDLSVYKGRGQVEYDKNGNINDNLPINATFLAKMKEKNGKTVVIPLNTTPDAVFPEQEQKTPPHPKFKPDESPLDKEGVYSLDQKLKKALLHKTEVQTRIEEIKEQKMLGMLIPTEIVKGMMLQLNKAFISSFKDGAENFLIEIGKTKRLSGSESSKLLAKLIEMINNSSSKSIQESKTQMKIVISQFSEKRTRGEKK